MLFEIRIQTIIAQTIIFQSLIRGSGLVGFAVVHGVLTVHSNSNPQIPQTPSDSGAAEPDRIHELS